MGEQEQAGTGPSMGDVLDWSDQTFVRPRRRPRAAQISFRARVEAFLWGLFSAGGFAAAMLIPAQLAIIGIGFAAGWLPDDAFTYDRVLHLVRNPLAKLYLLALISLPLFHWAHRFRFIVTHQFGVHRGKGLIAVGCYGAAVVGSVLALVVLIGI
jgi:fumarate reductase subunit D